MSHRLSYRGEEIEADISLDGNIVTVLRKDEPGRSFEAIPVGQGEWLLREGHRTQRLFVAKHGDSFFIHTASRTHVVERSVARGGGKQGGSLVAPMTGSIESVLVSEGDVVEEGQTLLVLSAMKMQVEIRTPNAGTVTSIPHAAGDQVDGGTVLAVVSEAKDSDEAEA